ncbi:hypothetical protein [Empedobacter falsenii]|uniref:Uncharacterized protein n=1 Tax=Empedobacter falsenii TaxID=343874 RepID=A0A376GFQ0_9FLAO|nr:hypothetical protein [Empedobacter falsenii]STD59669.1 Uncharacterised protein [Empedobacter falsenii]
MNIPDRDQLRRTILFGDDSINNILIINSDAKFELIERVNDIEIENIQFITRFETFIADNDYVGENASKDFVHINRIYISALKEWANYLEYKSVKTYCDLEVPVSETLDELLGKIRILNTNSN